jgi:tRNA pseudouridine55 synthase
VALLADAGSYAKPVLVFAPDNEKHGNAKQANGRHGNGKQAGQ